MNKKKKNPRYRFYYSVYIMAYGIWRGIVREKKKTKTISCFAMLGFQHMRKKQRIPNLSYPHTEYPQTHTPTI